MGRTNKGRVLIVQSELASHLSNEHMDIAVIRVPFPVPNSVHELVASQDLTGIFNQC